MNRLPEIPDKLYFTIGEVGNLCDLKPHVLRYWEQEFPQLSPSKRRGNRRYYKREDVLLIRKIKQLLYAEGFTIEGARHQLMGNPKANYHDKIQQQINHAVGNLERVVKELESN